jgi:hypothetical protein
VLWLVHQVIRKVLISNLGLRLLGPAGASLEGTSLSATAWAVAASWRRERIGLNASNRNETPCERVHQLPDVVRTLPQYRWVVFEKLRLMGQYRSAIEYSQGLPLVQQVSATTSCRSRVRMCVHSGASSFHCSTRARIRKASGIVKQGEFRVCAQEVLSRTPVAVQGC